MSQEKSLKNAVFLKENLVWLAVPVSKGKLWFRTSSMIILTICLPWKKSQQLACKAMVPDRVLPTSNRHI